MYVIKTSGQREKFNPRKLIRTCTRAGASKNLCREVVEEVKNKAYDGISTTEILRMTLSMLEKKPEVAIKYNLKSALMVLGPSGFPFEKYISAVLQNYGYETSVGLLYQGKNVRQEVDITAIKGKRFMVECKYHNGSGIFTDLKVAMYTYARYLDIQKHFDQPWLITNTKCTSDAANYAKGVGLKITSWSFPENNSLENLIESKKLYPVTMLSSISKKERDILSKSGITLLKDLAEMDFRNLRIPGINEKRFKKLIKEAGSICF
jgi:hypothetical protein